MSKEREINPELTQIANDFGDVLCSFVNNQVRIARDAFPPPHQGDQMRAALFGMLDATTQALAHLEHHLKSDFAVSDTELAARHASNRELSELSRTPGLGRRADA